MDIRAEAHEKGVSRFGLTLSDTGTEPTKVSAVRTPELFLAAPAGRSRRVERDQGGGALEMAPNVGPEAILLPV